MKKRFLPLLLVPSMVSAEQLCDGDTQTTPSENFTVISEATEYVVDNTTGLAWARCVVGQSWDSTLQSCTGEPLRLTWQEALQQATTYRAGNHTDWRLPNVKELVSVVERQCVEPAANLDLFPAAPDDRYWSSTPYTGSDSTTTAWAVAFYNGRIDTSEKTSDFYVRMVRYAE